MNEGAELRSMCEKKQQQNNKQENTIKFSTKLNTPLTGYATFLSYLTYPAAITEDTNFGTQNAKWVVIRPHQQLVLVNTSSSIVFNLQCSLPLHTLTYAAHFRYISFPKIMSYN